MFQLSINAATAIATYGVLLHTGAAARREFCIAVVGEAIETGESFETIADAAKLAADYEGMDDAERALFRKQLQYCRAIVKGWKQLGAANQRAFVGGSLPASSAEKLLKAKAPASAPASDAEPASAPSTTAQAVEAGVIGGAEAAVIFANWLDGLAPDALTVAQAKAVKQAADALEAFRAKVADVAKAPLQLAA